MMPVDERLHRLERTQSARNTHANAVSDSLLGAWWGTVGATATALGLCVLTAVVALMRGGAGAASGAVPFVVGSAVFAVLAGVGVGTLSGIIAAAVARYGDGKVARGVAGLLAAILPFIVMAMCLLGSDIPLAVAYVLGKMLLVGGVLAAGSGLSSGLNVGREIGT
jgi:hypothetical protein